MLLVRRTASVLMLICIDAGALMIAVLAEALVSGEPLWPGLSTAGLATSGTVVLVFAAFGGLYGRRYSRHRAGRVLTTWGTAFMVSSLVLLAVDSDALGAHLVTVWVVAFALSLAGRWIFDAFLILRYGVDGDCPRAVLLGDLASCMQALPSLATMPPESRLSVVGLVLLGEGIYAAPESPEGVPSVLGTADALRDVIQTAGASEVIIADAMSINGQLRHVMSVCRSSRVALKVVAAPLQLDGHAVSYVPGLDCPVFVVAHRPTGWASYLVKRLIDRVIATVLLVALLPLFLMIAVAIKVTSRGPVFYVDYRVGIDQQPFLLYKFRTMTADAAATQSELEDRNEADGVLFKMRNDPRITRVGRVLRRVSLDELPQLLNVLKGDMSLVGPRPLPLRDCEAMEEWHRRRHVVLPGITGLWQVSGRSDLGFSDMVHLDLRYIESWTLRNDAYIAWRTVGAVFGKRGAY